MAHISEERISEIADLKNQNTEESAHIAECSRCHNQLNHYQQVTAILVEEMKTEPVDFSGQIIKRLKAENRSAGYGNGVYLLIAATLLVTASVTLYFFPVTVNFSSFENILPNVPFIKNNLNTVSSIIASVVLMLSLERLYLKFKH